MIRINLLSVERQLPGRRFTFDLGGQTTVLSALILVVAAVLVVSQFFSLRAESQALDDELAGARQEIQRLQAELEQVRLFDERRAQLELRIALIAELQRGQVGPVQMLDQVSQNLPDSIWLADGDAPRGQRPGDPRAGHDAERALRFRGESGEVWLFHPAGRPHR